MTVDGSKLDPKFLGIDKINIPVIKYSPEEIFKNEVPALDVNFMNPTANINGNTDRNIAKQIQPTIASWYIGIRTISAVGLISVLLYLGIRMLLTSAVADKAKYKKMLFDWLVAMILLFALHYIMSFVLTMSETITQTIAGNVEQGALHVVVTGGSDNFEFSTNLIGYVRFMIQHNDLTEKVSFLALYIMLIVFSVKFTWTYLKRVVNMAFLTIIAPFVALTYPLDKVADGHAQAFNMWLKEYIFNALLQPLHLLLYRVLLGTAMDVAALNPLYAIVCLAFMTAAEKLVKQMFGFNKAGAGTVGSLAGAAGITALASTAVRSLGKKAVPSKGGGSNKIRTANNTQRKGRNTNANHGFDAFNTNSNRGIPAPNTESSESPTYSNDNQDAAINKEDLRAQEQQRQQENRRIEEDRRREFDRRQQEDRRQNEENDNRQQEPNTSGSPIPEYTDRTLRNMVDRQQERQEQLGLTNENSEFRSDMRRAKGAIVGGAVSAGRAIGNGGKKVIKGVKGLGKAETYANLGRRAADGIKAVPRNANMALGRGYTAAKGTIKKYAPVAGTALYGAARTAAKAVPGAMVGATGALVAGAITAASTGDAEKALAAAGTAFAGGAALGGGLFEATVGQIAPERSVRTAYDTAKYGSNVDAANARADKAFLKSEEFDQYYRREIKGTSSLKHMSKKDAQEAFRSYREAGITDNDTIKKALKLEQEKDANGQQMFSRAEAQNIVQTSGMIDSKAYVDDKVKAKEIKRISGMLGNIKDEKQRNNVANKIFTGYEKYRDI